MESRDGVEETQPEDVSSDAPLETRSRLVRKNRELRDQRNRLRTALVVTAGGLMVALGFLLFAGGLESGDDLERLESQLAELKVELRLTRNELAEATAETEALVQQRIPGLRRIQFDQVLEVGDGGVRNVLFTIIRDNRGAAYEYKIVVHNDSRQLRRPLIHLILFDRVGMEIARARIGYGKALAKGEDPPLEPGEIRSYSGGFEVQGSETPAFFRIATG